MAAPINADQRKKRLIILTMINELNETSSDESETDDDLGALVLRLRLKVKRQRRNRQKNYVQNVVRVLRPDEFKLFFRISRGTVEMLEGWIHNICQENLITGITDRQGTGGSKQTMLHERLLATLWFMASKDKIASIADRFGMCESTVSVSVRKLLSFINTYLRDKIICWPSNDDKLEIAGTFEDLHGYPGVLGMVDGTHIPIPMPTERGFDYYNRHDYYSVVLQAVCREDLRFTNVYCGWPGKVHDARVFRNSPLYEDGQELCGDGNILGDSAYPNIGWCLTPFKDNGHLTPAQTRFNKIHSAIRCTVERAFCLLKGRFPRLKFLDQHDVDTIVTTILAACVLHNICIMNNDELDEVILEQENPGMPQCAPCPQNYDMNLQQRGATKRLNIARRLLR